MGMTACTHTPFDHRVSLLRNSLLVCVSVDTVLPPLKWIDFAAV